MSTCLRSVQAACEEGKVRSSFPLYYCEKCSKETIYPRCENCGSKTRKQFYFYEMKQKAFSKKLEGVEGEGLPYCNKDLDVNYYFNDAVGLLGLEKHEIPVLIKGVRGVSSGEKGMEHLATR